jgi:hypothetical protein
VGAGAGPEASGQAASELLPIDLFDEAKGEPAYRLLGGPMRYRMRVDAGILAFST